MAKETNSNNPQTVAANAMALSIVKRPDGKAELRRLNYNLETNRLVNVETLLTSNMQEVQEQFKIQAFDGFFI